MEHSNLANAIKLTSREHKKEDTVIEIREHNIKIGQGYFCIIAGPCAVENFEQTLQTAKKVKSAGATILRGGAFKPRTSPYSFQGLGKEGLKILKVVREETGLSIVTEVLSQDNVEDVAEVADILQIGARNMQNFPLLDAVSKLSKPILLKRGFMATIAEFLLSAEYLMARGNENIILCERGIRTFETQTRNTLDISAVPVIKRLSHLPIIVDPSHACGVREYVKPLSMSAVAAGADGIMVEVHPNPDKALSDGIQSIDFEQFDDLIQEVTKLAKFLGKQV